jgi:ABC-type uncharacterized transport system ATPase subunit
MPYIYEIEKEKIFTEDGVKMLLTIRDNVAKALENSGAFIMHKITTSGDSWTQLAVLDYMVEQGEIHEVTGNNVAGQHRVFVK